MAVASDGANVKDTSLVQKVLLNSTELEEAVVLGFSFLILDFMCDF